MLTPVELTALYIAMGTGIAGFIISNSGDKRNIRQFFNRPDLFIEIRTDEPDTFRPVLQIPELDVLRQRSKVSDKSGKRRSYRLFGETPRY